MKNHLLLSSTLLFGWFPLVGGFLAATSNQESQQYFLLSSTLESDVYPDTFRVVVVGSGVGGLATAARIASSDPTIDVTILEKNEHVGGRSGSFDVQIPNVGTFRHERGASLLLLPHIYNQLFEDCSANAKDFGLDIRPCVPAYQVVFDDGDRLNIGFPAKICSSDASIQAQHLESRKKMDVLEPNGALKWDEYQKACSAFLDCGLPNFIEERLDLWSFPAFLLEALKDYGKVRHLPEKANTEWRVQMPH